MSKEVKIGEYVVALGPLRDDTNWRLKYCYKGERLEVVEVDRWDIYVYCPSTGEHMLMSHGSFKMATPPNNKIGGTLIVDNCRKSTLTPKGENCTPQEHTIKECVWK